MTADVAPGPARKAGNGIVMLAKLSGRPIVPCAMATNRYLTLNNWSAFTINLPFSKLGIVVGDPVRVPEDADSAALEAARIAVERGLNQATARAYELAGATDPLLPAVQVKDAPKPAFALRAYRALTRYAAPVAPLLLAWRTRIGKEEPARRPERYGEASVPRPSGFLVWFHAASVGEANAVLPVIDAIATEHPEIGLLLTTGTVTSAKLARARLPKGAVHQYVPLDNQDYVRRFLEHWQPDLAVFVESEIWPNLVLETNALNVPLVLVNGRMSFRSFRRWRNRPGLSRPLFSAFGLVLAQNERFAQRFTALGTPRTVAVGNLKADAPPPPVDLAGHKKLAAALAGRTVWLAASTHPGEDDIAAVAHLAMKKARPDLLTVIVPRHPERGPFIARLLEGANLKVALRSEGKLPEAGTDIYIADTIGELGLFYNLVPVALIGGSLVPHGGQNPVEAIKLGAAVVTGPHWRNFADAYEELLASGGCGAGERCAKPRHRRPASARGCAGAGADDGPRRGRHRSPWAAPCRAPSASSSNSCRRRRRCNMPLRAPFWWYRRAGALASALSPSAAIYGRMAERKAARGQALPLAPSGDLHRQFHRWRRRQDADGHCRRRSAEGSGRAALLPHPRLWRQGARARCSVDRGPERGRGRRRDAAAARACADRGLRGPRGRRQGDRRHRRHRHRHG